MRALAAGERADRAADREAAAVLTEAPARPSRSTGEPFVRRTVKADLESIDSYGGDGRGGGRRGRGRGRALVPPRPSLHLPGSRGRGVAAGALQPALHNRGEKAPERTGPGPRSPEASESRFGSGRGRVAHTATPPWRSEPPDGAGRGAQASPGDALAAARPRGRRPRRPSGAAYTRGRGTERGDAVQDGYAGDVGDFGKYGLLRALCLPDDRGPALRLGVHWHRVRGRGGSATGDGSHTQYIHGPSAQERLLRACDPDLFARMRRIVGGERTIDAVEGSGALPQGTLFFGEALDFTDVPLEERRALRSRWREEGLRALAGADVVFHDPDNGLEAPSVGPLTKAGAKYARYDDLRACRERGQSLVVYHHLGRTWRGPPRDRRGADRAPRAGAAPRAARGRAARAPLPAALGARLLHRAGARPRRQGSGPAPRRSSRPRGAGAAPRTSRGSTCRRAPEAPARPDPAGRGRRAPQPRRDTVRPTAGPAWGGRRRRSPASSLTRASAHLERCRGATPGAGTAPAPRR